jgi:transketolase
LAAHGGFIPFTATFLNFIEYAYGAVRLSALSNHKQIFIMTHDSIGLGEDGPTHQPIEALALVRATPNMLTFRPCDGNEVAGSYCEALKANGPSVLALSRQNLPNMEASSMAKVAYGGYVIYEESIPASNSFKTLVIVATGSEVEIAVKAAKLLAKEGLFKHIHVVSMVCSELFDKQSTAYRQSTISVGSFVVSVEAAATFGWERYAHYNIGMTTYGESAPYEALYDYFGFTGEKVAKNITNKVREYEKMIMDTQTNNNMGKFPLLPTHFDTPPSHGVHNAKKDPTETKSNL